MEEYYDRGSCRFFELLIDLNRYVIQKHSSREAKTDTHIKSKIDYYTRELERCLRDMLYRLESPDVLFKKLLEEMRYLIEHLDDENLHPETVSTVHKVLTEVVEDYTKSAYSYVFRLILERAIRRQSIVREKEESVIPRVLKELIEAQEQEEHQD